MQHAKRHYSLEDYFDIEEMSDVRHEYFDGEIYAMAGGTRDHNQISQNLSHAFDPLRPRCRAYVADVRLKTPGGLYTYPDVMLICGQAVLTTDRLETLTNPLVLAEVLSASTCDYDRGLKGESYQEIPTLRDYLLIDQYAVSVEHRALRDGRWSSTYYESRNGAVELAGVTLTIPLAAIHELVL